LQSFALAHGPLDAWCQTRLAEIWFFFAGHDKQVYADMGMIQKIGRSEAGLVFSVPEDKRHGFLPTLRSKTRFLSLVREAP
jgi:hypothetical protein